MTKPLLKMLEDANEPSYVRELLEAGRDFRVTDYDYSQGLAQHLAHVEMGTPPPDWAQTLPQGGSAAGGAAAGAASIPLAAWIAAPVVTAGVIAAVMLSREPAPVPAPVQGLDVPAVVSPAGEELQVEAAVAPAPAPEPAAVPGDSRPEATLAAAETAPAKPAVTRRASTPRPEREATQAVVPAAKPPTSAATPVTSAPSRPRSAAQRARDLEDVLREPPPSMQVEPTRDAPVERARTVEQEPAERDDASLEREMRMLAVAQRVLHSDPSRALRLARQGEREFPDTMFTQERRHVLLLALIELGRMDEARRLAGPYLKQYPKGPFSDRVRRALATGRVER